VALKHNNPSSPHLVNYTFILFYNIDILEELSIDFRKNTTKMELNCNSIEHCYDITKILL
jgi:hypothetical protein